MLDTLRTGGLLSALHDRVSTIAQRSFIDAKTLAELAADAWEKAVDTFLDDGVLDANEESRLVECKQMFLLSDAILDRRGALTRTAKAGVLRDLMDGKVPQRVDLAGVALNLQKGEKVIWAFPSTEYLEDKVRREYVGRSAGISVRVMKGVYYRAGAFKGHPVERVERVTHGKGVLVLTNKHLYFHASAKSFRVPYTKIVSFTPYSDGVGIMRDAASAKPQTFITGDGWFAYNVLANVNNLA